MLRDNRDWCHRTDVSTANPDEPQAGRKLVRPIDNCRTAVRNKVSSDWLHVWSSPTCLGRPCRYSVGLRWQGRLSLRTRWV